MGLIVVGVLLLLVLSLLLACCLAKLCGCCKPQPVKNKYYVTPGPSYKTVDPIYIVTPPPGDRHDLIYSTPYSGSPLPPPPAPFPQGLFGESNLHKVPEDFLHFLNFLHHLNTTLAVSVCQ